MRSEDLSGIPESIERWKVGELLEGLGFKPGSYKNVAEILIEPRSVTVHAYATNAEGKRYLADAETYTDPKTRSEPAMHEISVPFVGDWEKPATAVETVDEPYTPSTWKEVERCGSRHGGAGIRCHHERGHEGDHQLGSVCWAAAVPEPIRCPGRSESLDGSSASCELMRGHADDCQGIDSHGSRRRWLNIPAN